MPKHRQTEAEIVFESIDKNHDGVISKEEFEDAYGTKIVTPPNSPGRERPSGNNVAQRGIPPYRCDHYDDTLMSFANFL